jgi:hypothetical protein
MADKDALVCRDHVMEYVEFFMKLAGAAAVGPAGSWREDEKGPWACEKAGCGKRAVFSVYFGETPAMVLEGRRRLLKRLRQSLRAHPEGLLVKEKPLGPGISVFYPSSGSPQGEPIEATFDSQKWEFTVRPRQKDADVK